MGQVFKSKTFRSGNSQAVRIPASVAFADGTELEIERNGDVVTMRPAQAKNVDWKSLFAKLDALPKPSTPWVWERIEFPRRPWHPEDPEDTQDEAAE